jgi:hypothetical protein
MKIHPIINALVWPLFDLAWQTYTVIQQNFMRKFSIDFVSSESFMPLLQGGVSTYSNSLCCPSGINKLERVQYWISTFKLRTKYITHYTLNTKYITHYILKYMYYNAKINFDSNIN